MHLEIEKPLKAYFGFQFDKQEILFFFGLGIQILLEFLKNVDFGKIIARESSFYA